MSLDPEMAHFSDDETADHIDLLERIEGLDPPVLRRLTLVFGHDGTPADAVWDIGEGSRILGRDPGPHGIVLPASGSSRRHARLSFDAHQDVVHLEDLESRNGTYVDGTRVERAELRHGTVIRIADAILVFSQVNLPPGLPRPHPSLTISPRRAVSENHVDIAARTKLPILVLGPTGAGKERLARRIHERSARTGPLVAVNCGALNRDLIASELFGHVAGAFTGASAAQPGLFVTADKGTLFLDEIADLPLEQQQVLLRTLQEGTVRPVGASAERSVDVRVIAATHRPIDGRVEQDLFRQDLYARLAGFTVTLPGLAERREEVLPLLEAFSKIRASSVAPDAAEALFLHTWPQNVREVQHLGARLEMVQTRALEIADLPPHFRENITGLRRQRAAPSSSTLDREALVELLERHQGNVATIAKALGKHRAQVYRWLRREGLDPDTFRIG